MLKIMVVDDHEPSLSITSALLKSLGYVVTTAINGYEALDKIRQELPDVVVSDVLMPVMDGYALCRELKKDKRLQSVPVIFISSTFVDPEDKELGLGLGAEAYIIKSQKADDFMKELQVVIQKCTATNYATTVSDKIDESCRDKYYDALTRKLRDKILQLEEASQRIYESEERFRVLFEQANDAIFLHDLTGSFFAVNPKACDSLGYTKDELLNLRVSDVDPDFVVRGYKKKFWPALPVTFESRHKRKDGLTFPVDVRLSKIILREQSLVLAIVSDITERKQREKEVKEQLGELQRWHEVVLGREERIQELKDEVNALLMRLGEPARYAGPDDIDGSPGALEEEV